MLADPTPIVALEPPLGDAQREVLNKVGRRDARVIVRGGAGSGRSSLVTLLGAAPGAVLLEPPDVDEPDAVGHESVQLAVRTGAIIPDAAPSADILARALARAGELDSLVVTRLPSSWAPADGGRVAEIVNNEVRLVVAAPPGDRILLKRLARAARSTPARFAAEDLLGRFVEIGEYGDRTILEPLSHVPPASVDMAYERRYLSDWDCLLPMVPEAGLTVIVCGPGAGEGIAVAPPGSTGFDVGW